MSNVTQILSSLSEGSSSAPQKLLPLIYEELRRLAAQKMAGESPAQTLQATALVHEAYVRLVNVPDPQHWNGRGHFFAAAAEAMRRILVENARRKKAAKNGGHLQHVDLNVEIPVDEGESRLDLLALDDALQQLATEDPDKAELVKLRYFAGLTTEEAAAALNISRSTAVRQWCFARAWLLHRIGATDES